MKTFCATGPDCSNFVKANCPTANNGTGIVWALGMNGDICARRYYTNMRNGNGNQQRALPDINSDLLALERQCMDMIGSDPNRRFRCDQMFYQIRECNADPGVYHQGICNHKFMMQLNSMFVQRALTSCQRSLINREDDPSPLTRAGARMIATRCREFANRCEPQANDAKWGVGCLDRMKSLVASTGSDWEDVTFIQSGVRISNF
jgi:hypothetical protein